MSRAGIIAVALLFTGASVARAQDAQGSMLGLPLVIKEGGWARYTGDSSDGPTEFVFKVGGTGSRAGKKGRWIILEVDVPQMGRLALHFLVAGDRFLAENVLQTRVQLPGQPLRDSEENLAGGSTAPPSQPRVLKKGTATIAGHKIDVTEYAYPGGSTVGWSAAVPPLGLTHLSGEESFQLVAFGVGGDPWKGAAEGAVMAPPAPPAPKK